MWVVMYVLTWDSRLGRGSREPSKGSGGKDSRHCWGKTLRAHYILATGAYSSACIKCYKLKFSIPGIDFRLLVLSKRKFQRKQVSYLQNGN